MDNIGYASFGLPYEFLLFENPVHDSPDGPRRSERRFVSAEETQMVRAEISSWPGYRPTPLHRLSGLAQATGVAGLLYKDEGYRFGLGSFKPLGGAFAVFRWLQAYIGANVGTIPTSADLRIGKYGELTRKLTVATATDGNHGRAVAWGAQLFGCRCVVYVPRQCSNLRKAAIESYGARVVRTAFGYDDTVRLCTQDAAREGWKVVSDTSWDGYEDIPELILQGYSVIADEVLDQIVPTETPTHVFIQGGVGALAAAICAYFSHFLRFRRPRIIVVEPEGAACLYESAVASKPTKARGEVRTMMAGLSCGEPSPLAWGILAKGADFFLTVPDNVVSDCMKLLARPAYNDRPVVAGESAIAGLAGFLCVAQSSRTRQILDLSAESRVLVFGTEGDTDPLIYKDIVGCSGDDVRRLAVELDAPHL